MSIIQIIIFLLHSHGTRLDWFRVMLRSSLLLLSVTLNQAAVLCWK